MARIAGVDLPRAKRVEVALTYVYGVGPSLARRTLDATRVDAATRVSDLTDDEAVRLREWIDANVKVEGDLRRQVQQDIKRKIEIGSDQGVQQRRGLPWRGQGTDKAAR